MESNDSIIILLTKRLAEIPNIFLSQPKTSTSKDSEKNVINIKAVFNDLIYNLTHELLSVISLDFLELSNTDRNSNYLNLIGLICYVLNDQYFLDKNIKSKVIIDFIKSEKINKLSEIMSYNKFIIDSERREELVRLILFNFDILPQDESKNYFIDRLSTLDSVERNLVIAKGKEARERAKRIREELERKRREEEEAASKMSRE